MPAGARSKETTAERKTQSRVHYHLNRLMETLNSLSGEEWAHLGSTAVPISEIVQDLTKVASELQTMMEQRKRERWMQMEEKKLREEIAKRTGAKT